MRLLGLDPGLRITGWGVIEMAGARLIHIAHGVATSESHLPLAARLHQLYEQLSQVIDLYVPQEAACEEAFVNKNAASTLKLGAARGAVLLAPAKKGLPVSEYSANRVKKAVVGVGHAHKDQVGMMVQTLLPAAGDVKLDCADALAVAICHAHYWKANYITKVRS